MTLRCNANLVLPIIRTSVATAIIAFAATSAGNTPSNSSAETKPKNRVNFDPFPVLGVNNEEDQCKKLTSSSEIAACQTTIKLVQSAGAMYTACSGVTGDTAAMKEAIDKKKKDWNKLERPRIEQLVDQDLAKQKDDIEAIRGAIVTMIKAITSLEDEKHNAAADLVKKEIESMKKEIEPLQKDIEERVKILADATTNKKKNIEVWVEAIVQARSKALFGANEDNSGGLCKELCDGSAPTTSSPVNLCNLRAPEMASAAVIADSASVSALLSYVNERLTPTKKAPAMDRAGLDMLEEVELGTRARAVPLVPLAAPDAAAVGIDVAATTARTLDVAMAALAKVIVDRAKREGVGFFLEQLHRNVCSYKEPTLPTLPEEPKKYEGTDNNKKKEYDDKKKEYDEKKKEYDEKKKEYDEKEMPHWRVQEELGTYWLPTTCKLAGGDQTRQAMAQYGGGTELLGALQGAIAADVKRWPGVAAGLGTAALFWADTAPETDTAANANKAKESMLKCHDGGATDERCKATWQLREATAKMTAALMTGANPAATLHTFGTAINDLNNVARGEKRAFLSKKFQAAACAVSLPAVFQANQGFVSVLVPDQVRGAQSLLVGGLAGTPACATITVKGWKKRTCKGLSTSTTPTAACDEKDGDKVSSLTTVLAEGHNEAIERLTTVQRWGNAAGSAATSVQNEWSDLRSSWTTYKAAVEAIRQKDDVPTIAMPNLQIGQGTTSGTIEDAFVAAQNYVKNTARDLQQSKQVKLLQAASGLAHASVDLGLAVTGAGTTLTDESLFPGICDSTSCESSKPLHEGHEALVGLSHKFDTIDAALTQDWGQVVPKVIGAIQTDLKEACKNDQQCQKIALALGRYAGFFTALATSSDPEYVARALDAAAMPVGGWRAKTIPGTWNVTLSAFPGLNAFTGELRWGQYGVNYERGGEVHWNTPTLALPVGIDISRYEHVKFFVSVLDPAAYLQYDVDKDGRLPGAQLLTALAPGAAIRVPFGASPFSANLFAAYRPGFRAWESGLSGGGANVFQFGLSFTVDVTLFDIYSTQSNIEVSK